jgi:hypothetical protein
MSGGDIRLGLLESHARRVPQQVQDRSRMTGPRGCRQQDFDDLFDDRQRVR